MECLEVTELRKNKGDKYVNVSQVQRINPEQWQRKFRLMYQILDCLDVALVNSLIVPGSPLKLRCSIEAHKRGLSRSFCSSRWIEGLLEVGS